MYGKDNCSFISSAVPLEAEDSCSGSQSATLFQSSGRPLPSEGYFLLWLVSLAGCHGYDMFSGLCHLRAAMVMTCLVACVTCGLPWL